LYHLSDASSFFYLNQSGNLSIDGVDDGSDFHEVQSAMDGLGFSPQEKHSIFTIVAWILHVGNLRFVSTGEKKCQIENIDDLRYVASLMEVGEKELIRAITNRVMVVRGQAPMDISLGVEESMAARDALSKFVFAKLFDWLVLRINQSIGIGGGQKGRSIGILDIFGFEIFQLVRKEKGNSLLLL
jgi:myosin heavy subunit